MSDSSANKHLLLKNKTRLKYFYQHYVFYSEIALCYCTVIVVCIPLNHTYMRIKSGKVLFVAKVIGGQDRE